MGVLKGDFIGFTFNGFHSSELGIVRTSDGSRFNENLLPVYSDKTAQVPGGDGTYYFGSNFTQKVIDLPIAFDSLTENQLRKLKQILSNRQLSSLILDELPYKVYNVKINGNPSIKYICFDEEGQRTYKGEGSLSFICYTPFARSRYKYLEDYTKTNIPEWETETGNLNEWIESSGIKSKLGLDTYSNGTINLYNPGDFETDFKLIIDKTVITSNNFQIYIDGDNSKQLNVGFDLSKIQNETFICIDTKVNLIYGCDANGNTNGNIYNNMIKNGNFFKIENQLENSVLTIVGLNGADSTKVYIRYNYLYI
jgi:hypothetical protein